MENSVRSGGYLKKKTSSGCLIIKRKDDRMGIGGITSHKRPRLVMNDCQSSDERLEPFHRKNGQNFINGGAGDREFGNRNLNTFDLNEYRECDAKKHWNNGYVDDRSNIVERSGSRREFGGGPSRSVMPEKRNLSYVETSSSFSGSRTKGNDHGFKRRYDLDEDEVHMPTSFKLKNQELSCEPIRLQGKNGVLKVMVNKNKKNDIVYRHYNPLEVESTKGPRSEGLVKRELLVHPSYSGSEHLEKRPLSIKNERTELKPQKPLLGKSIHLVDSEKNVTDTSLKLAPPSSQPASSTSLAKKEESRPLLASEDVTPAKGKDGKVKQGGSTEKQQLRERIRGMLSEAGWTIDYRPRKNRDYLDAVYINPSGTAYWSIIKAYEAFQKKLEKDSGKSKPDGGCCSFSPISDDLVNKLTRRTRKKIEKEMKKNKKDDGKKRDHKKTCVNAERLKQDLAGKSSTGAFTNAIHGRKSNIIGRCTLLVRHLGSDNDGYVPYTGKRTLLSWLIDMGTLKLGQKVQYVNHKRTRVMLEGWITGDGVHCGCCSKILPVSKFEVHAGSKVRQPFQNIVLESGASLRDCLVDAWNQQKESDFNSVDIYGDDPADDACGICRDGGDLICCDSCPSTFHQSCLGIQMLPPGIWHCPNCTCKFCGAATTKDSVCKLLCCKLCERKYHKSCSMEMDASPGISNNPSVSLCGQKCRELYDHLQKNVGVKHELEAGLSWSLIQRTDLDSDISQRLECNCKLAVALSVMDECFLPIVDRRTGINVIHNVLYNSGSNFSRLNFCGFYTAVLERGDEIISAASIRIRGAQVAEMPFIGTRNLYRRRGMCRRLLSAIETVLCTIKVERLIIPAISEHLHTWTKVFGFDELEESSKQEMKSFNMLVFPGTGMLQKRLLKQDIRERCELQHCHLQSPGFVEKEDEESSIRHDGRLHDGTCQNIVEKSNDKVGTTTDSDSPVSARHLSDSSMVRAQGGFCGSDIQIFSKEVENNYAESATKLVLSSPSGASNGTPDTGDTALDPPELTLALL